MAVKYTTAHGDFATTEWLKIIANETAETNRLLRILFSGSADLGADNGS